MTRERKYCVGSECSAWQGCSTERETEREREGRPGGTWNVGEAISWFQVLPGGTNDEPLACLRTHFQHTRTSERWRHNAHTHVRLAGAMLRDALRRGASRDWASGFKAQDPLLMGMGRRNCRGGDVYKTEASLQRLFIDLQLVWRTWKSHPRWVRSTRFASYSRGLSVGSWDPVGTVGIVRNDETCR